MAQKILLTGGSSLLGAGLINQIPPKFELIVTFNKHSPVLQNIPNLKKVQLEITNKKQVEEIIKHHQPNIIIHAAAIGDVDYCQKNQDEAWKINVIGTQNIIKGAKKIGAHLIFISSNAVFGGDKPIYTEKDTLTPINFYGRTKAEGEKMVKDQNKDWTIARLITMYGWQPESARFNPVTWLLSKIEKGEQVKIVNDVFLNPLYNLDAADGLWKLVQTKKNGIYNIAGAQTINRYQWAVMVAKAFGISQKLIQPVSSQYFSGKIAVRPSQTVFSINKIKQELNFKPQKLITALKQMKKNRPEKS